MLSSRSVLTANPSEYQVTRFGQQQPDLSYFLNIFMRRGLSEYDSIHLKDDNYTIQLNLKFICIVKDEMTQNPPQK